MNKKTFKLKQVLTYLIVSTLLISLSTCKKYEEGGLTRLTLKHLFGGNNVGDSKAWKLSKYEVNGIDSTIFVNLHNNIPDFSEAFIKFKYEGSTPSPHYSANTFLQNYTGSIDRVSKLLIIGFSWQTHEDSLQCKTINSQLVCERNILIPEFIKSGSYWKIVKLTKSEIILAITHNNSYKIILTH